MAVPVWGIEAGDGTVRAIRLAPREDGGFLVLDYREEPIPGPGPEALVTFLRRRGLKRHAIAVAMLSPTSWFRSVRLSPDDLARPRDDMGACLAEYIPPEPSAVDFKWTVTGENLYLIAAEQRARVESYMIALETAQVPAYGLVAGGQALHAGAVRSGLIDGDGVLIRVLDAWTDILFLDDGQAARQAVPLGRRDLDDEAARKIFAADVLRLLDYHRTRVAREEPERFFLLGLEGEANSAVAALLPAPPIPFPEDASTARGGGRMSLTKALKACHAAPAALGAALSVVAEPRNEELSLRVLPTQLPKPPAPALPWFAASALLWLALAVAAFGLSAQRNRLGEILDRPTPSGPALTPKDAATLAELCRFADRKGGFPAAAAAALRAIPSAESAPYETESLSILADGSGAYEVDVTLLFPSPVEDRIAAAIQQFEAATGVLPDRAKKEGKCRLHGRFRPGGPK